MSFQHVSASSIKLFESCPRRWYYRYILGRKEESSASMELGSAVHTVLESYLKTGAFEGEGIPLVIAQSGEHLLPAVADSGDLRIEMSLDEMPLEGLPIPFKGFIDCLIIPADGSIPEVLDHKTTSSFRYAKSPAELAQDTQMIIYAKHVLAHLPAHDEIRLTHIAYLTKEPYGDARKATVIVSRQQVDRAFDKIMETVYEMLKAAEVAGNQQKKNNEYCYSYGKRCPFYNECHITLQSTEVNMSNKQQEVLNKLRNKAPAMAAAVSNVLSKPAAKPADDDGITPWSDIASPEGDMLPALDLAGVVNKVKKPAEKKPVAEPVVVAEPEVGGTLYVDCYPLGQPVPTLSNVLAEDCDKVAKQHGAESLELIPYGAGYAHLSVALRGRKLPTAYVSSTSALYMRCLAELEKCYNLIVVKAG